MQRLILLVASIAVIALLNWSVYSKERLIETGETVYFELAPRDPRSLMQGDYMRLAYAIGRDARSGGKAAKSGSLVVRLDERNIAAFARIHAGEALADNERLIRYRRGRRGVEIAPDAFFFQEGHAQHYSRARYGVFKYGAADDRVLVALADEALATIAPPDPAQAAATD